MTQFEGYAEPDPHDSALEPNEEDNQQDTMKVTQVLHDGTLIETLDRYTYEVLHSAFIPNETLDVDPDDTPIKLKRRIP